MLNITIANSTNSLISSNITSANATAVNNNTNPNFISNTTSDSNNRTAVDNNSTIIENNSTAANNNSATHTDVIVVSSVNNTSNQITLRKYHLHSYKQHNAWPTRFSSFNKTGNHWK